MDKIRPEHRRTLWYWLAVGGGTGLSPNAPGTVGSIPGLALGAFAAAANQQTLLYGICICILITVVAWWSIHLYEKHTGCHDDSRVVIDEVAGQCLATAFLPLSVSSLLLSFVLFRFFDIVKRGPVGYVDKKVPGAIGTLGDDIIAGALAAGVGVSLLYLL